MKERAVSNPAYKDACTEFQSAAAAVAAAGGKRLQGGKSMQFPPSDEPPVHLFQYSARPNLGLPVRWEVQTNRRTRMSDGDYLVLVLDVFEEEPVVMRSSDTPLAQTGEIESTSIAVEALQILTQSLRKLGAS